ncbi:protein ALP1-like [Penaeus monodon]|uniref:protein ALP1-like n=1 Tax=Penaeus monodon TaxID=6687 RepID=UPI0018A7DF1B|nr:protein ALP1-like [Penaeus monodon]
MVLQDSFFQNRPLYLASGHTFTDLHYTFRMGISTISGIVNSVCQTIWAVLQEKCIPKPSLQQLQGIAEGFEKKAYFPHCIGAVDGKQIRTSKSQGSGSVQSNYKDCFSVVLMAVADSDYRFTFVDVGAYGNACDSSIFKNTSFWKSIDENELPLPEPKPLPGSYHACVPYVIVGDEAFGLHSNLMRPFGGKQLSIAKRVFNYRLNKARLYIEHAFGILSNKWRILHRPLNVSLELAVNIVKACCILHNFLQDRERYNFEDTVTIIGLDDLPRALSVRSGTPANLIRNAFTDYFMSKTGSLSWQFSKI